MEIDLGFPAEELGIFGRVNEDLQTILDSVGRRKIAVVRKVVVEAGDAAGYHAGFLAQAHVDGVTGFHLEIGIAYDELEGGVVRSAREEFLSGGRPLGNGSVHGQLPLVGEMVDDADRSAERNEILILLTRRSERREIRI